MAEKPQGPVVAIVGATAAGKSRLAMDLANEFPGEIISADSRQVYRRLDIGTAKPSLQDRRRAPHHLIDVVYPDEDFGLQQFIGQANQAYEQISRSGSVTYLVGGTGQYIWAMVEGWRVPRVAPDQQMRRCLEKLARESGIEAVHQLLVDLDPAEASRVDSLNLRRVIRAIEIARHGGRPTGPRKVSPGFDVLTIGLKLERPRLYRRIDARVDDMMAAGWLDEVRGLLDLGYDRSLPSMSGVGYGELSAHLLDEISLDEAVSRTKSRTRRFARQQHAWFRHNDPRIHWIDAEAEIDCAAGILREWLVRAEGERG